MSNHLWPIDWKRPFQLIILGIFVFCLLEWIYYVLCKCYCKEIILYVKKNSTFFWFIFVNIAFSGSIITLHGKIRSFPFQLPKHFLVLISLHLAHLELGITHLSRILILFQSKTVSLCRFFFPYCFCSVLFLNSACNWSWVCFLPVIGNCSQVSAFVFQSLPLILSTYLWCFIVVFQI